MAKPNPLATTLQRPLTKKRKRAAFAVAAISDVVQMGLFPFFIEGALSPWEIALDFATAIAILLIVGFRWRFAFALALELVPGVDMFPTWAALVVGLPATDVPDALPAPSPRGINEGDRTNGG